MSRGKVGGVAGAKALVSAQPWPTRELKQEKLEWQSGTQQTRTGEDSEAGGVVRTAAQTHTVPGKRRKGAVTHHHREVKTTRMFRKGACGAAPHGQLPDLRPVTWVSPLPEKSLCVFFHGYVIPQNIY